MLIKVEEVPSPQSFENPSLVLKSTPKSVKILLLSFLIALKIATNLSENLLFPLYEKLFSDITNVSLNQTSPL